MYTLSIRVVSSISRYLAGVARHAAVEAGEGAGWAAQPRGEDAAHGAGQRQPRADVTCTHKYYINTKIFCYNATTDQESRSAPWTGDPRAPRHTRTRSRTGQRPEPCPPATD